MRVLPTVFLASGALAAVVAPRDANDISDARRDCIISNSREMAADAPCGDYEALGKCFSVLSSASPSALADCYAQAGCSSTDAFTLSHNAQQRCEELFVREEELRRREEVSPKTTSLPSFGSMDYFEGQGLFRRTAYSGAACFKTRTVTTTTCELQTVGDKVKTNTCYLTPGPTSSCDPAKTCSMDRQGTSICMDLVNTLDVAGWIVTIIFATGIVAGVASITFLCCKDRKDQKRLTAKAEATALARAATKKKRAAERGPLMAQRNASAAGPGDPFHDSNRS